MSVKPQEAEELVHAIAGAGGGVLSIALTYPLLTISTRLQAESKDTKKEKKTLWQIVDEIVGKDGLTGLYAGLESAVLGMAITNFVYYYFYESAGRSFKRLRRKTQLNTVEAMLSGAIAGSATAVASNPIWVANTRMTVTKSNKSTISMMLQIIRDDGVLALFKGLKPALILVANPIIQFTVFEQLKNFVLNVQAGQSVLPPSWAFLLGAIGKLVATGITYPYITLKTRLHMVGDRSTDKRPEIAQSERRVTALEIIKREGISGIYQGIGYKLVQSILTAAFLFYFKEGLVLWSMKALRVLRQVRWRSLNQHRIKISAQR
ncbi:hypothetical protein HG536_0A04760 [Torulaspora globosa]|uniref:Peroxisomal membrane protein PMP47B n=1 Tax=Torulaspora globosa TaxID=48254 RepID=A0A7G3ZAX4_9SACH|nr:uncharacterized protein HG536_0A04760 [Torulaspora globosa]QLL30660.1 hypothetical protein HG536_0A04760 [Torulaspora globosa]